MFNNHFSVFFECKAITTYSIDKILRNTFYVLYKGS